MAKESMLALNDTLAPASQAFDIAHKRTQNQIRPINKLPTELLSEIFRVGEVEARATRRRNKNYFTVQELATKVCHHWRDVAIKNPSLWTYIHITRPPPNPLAVLFLERAGPGPLLEIDIELRSRYCKVSQISTKAWRLQLTLMNELLEFLSSHGAGAWRWRSIDICCKQPEVLINVIEHLSIGTPAPVLQFLRLKRKVPSTYPGIQEDLYLSYPDYFANQLSKTCPTLPSLRSVEFDLVPWGFVLERPLPLFAGLTRLNLTSAARFSCIAGLKDLLVASPMLESLSLDPIFTDNNNIKELPRIRLPSLHSLSVGGGSNPFSTLQILRIIQAPNLHTFFLFRSNLPIMVGYTMVKIDHVFLYIYSGDLPWDIADAATRDGPIYPKLRDLNASEMDIHFTFLRGILSAFQSVTHLTINLHQAELLLEDLGPCLLPNLAHLKISSSYGSCARLVRMLHFRQEQGYPIQTVELSITQREQVMEEAPPCKLLVHFGEDLDTDYNSNRSEMSVCESGDSDGPESGDDDGAFEIEFDWESGAGIP